MIKTRRNKKNVKKNKHYTKKIYKTTLNLYDVTTILTKGVKTKNLVINLSDKLLHSISPDEDAFGGKILPLFEEELECNKPIMSEKNYMNITHKITDLIYEADNHTNKKVNPRTDFFAFINNNWEKQQNKTSNDAYFTKVDSFRILQDRVFSELLNLVDKHIKENPAKTKQLKNFCQSYTNMSNFSGQENANNAINLIENYINLGELEIFLAYVNNNEVLSHTCPLVWTIIPDFYNSKKFSCLIDFTSLTLSNYDDYFVYDWDTPEILNKKKKDLEMYKNYINDVFSTYLGKNHSYNIDDVLECEKDIIIAANCNSIKPNNSKDPESFKPYKVTIEESKQLGFDWVKFCKAMGFKKIPPYYYTSSVNYIKCIMTNLRENWKGKWKAYWVYIYLATIQRYSSSHAIFHDFVKTYLQGQTKSMPPKKRLIFGLILGWNKLLTELYILSEPKRNRIEYVRNMSIDLKQIFISMVKMNTWLDPKTKKQALEKLEKLKIVFGSPEKILDYQELKYSSTNAYANLVELTSYRTQVWINLIDQPVISLSMVDWKNLSLIDTQAYIVNAFYTPNRNDIFIPYAYLQKPFINITERSREYNLAFIGYTLGHEMSHSLDKSGSQYDSEGNLRDWWSQKDKAIFKKKNDVIVKYYEAAALRDGIKFDANPSVGEDLADLVGTILVVTYLRNLQEFNKIQLLVRNYSFKELFTYLAIQARQSINKKAIQYTLDTNPHPLEKYRVNCVLGRLYTFQKLYGVKKGDPMWIKPDGFWGADSN